MKIAGGRLRGRSLEAPRGGLRPTAERVRTSIFDILAGVIEDTRVLDLFSGTGALGFEAISQGAAACTMVEEQPLQVKTMRRNAAQLLGDEGRRASIVQADVAAWLKRPAPPGPYGIVFADPPYDAANAWLPRLLDALPEAGLLDAVGLFVFEGHKQSDPVEAAGWRLLRDRRYGLTRIHVYRYDRPGVSTE